ncbi:MAG: nuclear transport factor 2 family protein [Solirubrobacteraceae bacterium]
MSAENVQQLRASNLGLNDGELDAVFALHAADVELRDLRHPPDLPEVVRGLDAVRHTVSQWRGVYERFEAEVYEYVDAEPWVLCDTRWHGTGRGSDLPIDVRGVDAYEFADGKIVRIVLGYPDMATARRAVAPQ